LTQHIKKSHPVKEVFRESITAPVYRHRQWFDDFDEYAHAGLAWNLEMRQLDRGQFRGEMIQLVTPGVILQKASFGRALDQRGLPPEGYVNFGIPARESMEFVWRNKTVDGNKIISFPLGGEHASVTQPGFSIFPLAVRKEILDKTSEALGLPSCFELMGGSEVVDLPPGALEGLRRLVLRTCRDFDRVSDGELTKRLNSDLVPELISTLETSNPVEHFASLGLRERVVMLAEEFILETGDEDLSVLDICQEIGVSQRTLQYAFQERFQMTPKAYLKAVKLNEARKALRRADPTTSTVIEIAAQWGFWHMGQFAADCRRHFGELPSETLRKPALSQVGARGG
jgi:AraC family ethanolamine operon transcriptional activator